MEQIAEKQFKKYYKKIVKLLGHNYTTNSDELNELGNKLFGNKFKGCFPSDKYPNLKKNDSMIINIDKSNQPGSHWCGVYCISKNKYLVFDSFGRKTKKILPKLGKGKLIEDTDYDKNQKKYQTDCGQRSMAYLFVCYEDGIKYAKLI